jgi:hypothetical protein
MTKADRDAELTAAVQAASHLPGPAPAPAPPLPPPKSPAESAYDRLIAYIRNFEAQLNASEEIAIGFTGNDVGVLQIEGIGFFAPDILTFYGRDEFGMKTQLVQHVGQLSVMLRAVPKPRAHDAPRRIGFHLQGGWQGGESGDSSA